MVNYKYYEIMSILPQKRIRVLTQMQPFSYNILYKLKIKRILRFIYTYNDYNCGNYSSTGKHLFHLTHRAHQKHCT